MDTKQATALKPKAARLKTPLAVTGILLGVGAYNYAFPHGPLNALIDVTPSTATERCIGVLRSPLCYVFGWTKAEGETPSNIAYREARLRVVALRHGMASDVRPSGGPELSDEDDLAGYRYWLGHASEAEFGRALIEFDHALPLIKTGEVSIDDH